MIGMFLYYFFNSYLLIADETPRHDAYDWIGDIGILGF